MDRDRVKVLRKTLGANLRTARSRQGITQEQMAELLDISPEVYGRMERGLIFPRLERLVDICEKLGESADRLLGHAPAEAPVPVLGPVPTQDELIPVNHRFRPLMQQLTPPQRVAVRRHMANLQRLLVTCLELKLEPPARRRKRASRHASAP